jgi:hypothetical protein
MTAKIDIEAFGDARSTKARTWRVLGRQSGDVAGDVRWTIS